MANTSVVVTLNGSNTNERKFVAELVKHLNARNIEVVADDLSLSENRVIHELLNHQWLILILTPETARLRRIQAVVNAALEYIEEGHLQGVIALSSRCRLCQSPGPGRSILYREQHNPSKYLVRHQGLSPFARTTSTRSKTRRSFEGTGNKHGCATFCP